MKTSIFIVLPALLLCHSTFAQKVRPAFYAGISTSVNAAGFTYQNNYGQQKMDYAGIQIAPFASIFGGVDFDKANHLILEVVIGSYASAYKTDISPNGSSQRYRKEVTLNYLSVPLLYRYVIGGKKSQKAKLFINLGPQFSFLASAKLKHKIADTEVSFGQFVNWAKNPNGTINAPASDKDLFKRMSFDAVAGIGGLFPLGKKGVKLSTELRGGFGLGDINAKDWRLKGYEGNASVDYKASHAYFGGIRIGVQFPFGQMR